MEKHDSKTYFHLNKGVQFLKQNKFILKIEKYGNYISIVEKALDYLYCEDKINNVLFVCKSWNLNLKRKIFKIFLVRDIENPTLKKNRTKIWIEILRKVEK